MTTKISEANIQDTTLANIVGGGSGGGPKISSIIVTDSSYNNLDDTAVALEGGYVKLIGSGFAAGCQVLLGLTPVSSVTFISETEVRAQLPATAAGTYIIYLVNSDGGTAIRVNAVTFSGTPTWVSGSALAGEIDTAISIQLTATDATTFALAAGSTLPPGVTLSSGGLLSGTITGITEETVYNFTINAVDSELQDSPRSFAFTVTAGDQYFNLTTLLLPGAATTFVSDASSNNFAVSIAGDTRPNTFNPYLTGWSNYFDGTGDYLSMPSNAAFAFGTGDFTIEAWVYLTGLNATANGIFQQGTSSFPASVSNTVAFATLNTSNFQIYAANAQHTFSPAVVPLLSTWYHFAVVRSSGTTKAYINGVAGISVSDTTNYTGTYFGIGNIYGFNGYTQNGYISNLRVVKGTALYTANFTPSTAPLEAISGTSLLTCQSNRFRDASTNNFAVTRNGDVAVRSFSPFAEPATVNGSTYFDGSDYLSLANNDAFNCGTGDFTLETWYYHDGGTALYPSIFSSTDWDTGTGGVGLRFNNTAMSNKFGFFWYGVGDPFLSASFTSAPYAWHHVAVTRSGNTFTLWVDGVSAATGTASGTINFNLSTGGPRIGWGPWDGSNGYLKAYLNNLRLVKGTALYTTAFTPPAEPLTAVSGTSLLTLQNNTPANNHSFLDSSTNNLLITRSGNATQGTFSPYSPAGWSNSFDGTGDYIQVADSPAFTFGSGDFTIEYWFNAQQVTTAMFLYGQINAAASTGSRNVYDTITSGKLITQLFASSGSIGEISSTLTLVPGVWYHVAITRNSNIVTQYINGSQTGTVSVGSTALNDSPDPFSIGRIGEYASNIYAGFISNFRVVKGTAVYTSNFTPSTTPLTAIAGTSLLTCQSPQFVDNSPNRFAITRVGDVRVVNFAPHKAVLQTPQSYSTYFDGTGDLVQLASSSAFNLGEGDFTIEMWVNLDVTNIQGQYFFQSTGFNPNMFLWSNGAIYLRTAETTGDIITPIASGIVAGVWAHVACVRSGNTYRIYINGNLLASSTSTAVTSANSELFFGKKVKGYISNFRLVKGTAVYTANFTPPTTPLTAVAGTSLLTCQSPTFVDNSTNNFAITAAGNSQPSTVNPFGFTFANSTGYTAAEYGGSMYFDGGGDYLSAPSNTAFSPGTSDFTIECWAYLTATTGEGTLFYINATNGINLFLSISSNWGIARAGIAVDNNFGTPPSFNTWNHLAVSRSGSTIRAFINGTQVFSGSNTTNYAQGAALIGSSNSFGTVTGYISDFRVVKGTALYTSSFVPPAAPVQPIPNTTLLLNGTSAAITDATTRNVVETVGDARISTAVAKFGGSSMSFDGTGDRLIVPSSPNFDFPGNFTIEMWINFTNVTSTWEAIISRAYGVAGGWRLYKNDANNQLRWYSNVTSVVLTTGSTLANNTWSHIAVVRNSETVTIYIDGVNRGSAVNTTSYTPGNYALEIGEGVVTSAYPFEGYLQDLRITKGHARYTANFTPPATAFQTR